MLAIFESHPVQYRAPVYRELQRLVPDRFHVFYATDISVRGNHDVEFGKTMAWDEPLLEGYPNTVLNLERGEPLKGFRSLHGSGVARILDSYRCFAVMQTQFLYEYDFAVLFQAWLRRIPIWIRQETQDEAFERSPGKDFLRSIIYRSLYSMVEKAFFFGELNRKHLLRCGLQPAQLIRAPYSTPDRFENVSETEFKAIRQACRSELDIENDRLVIGFFGKLIPKKNPDLLLKSIPFLGEQVRNKVTLLFVGAGELEVDLRVKAREFEAYGVQTVFAGFINQTAIGRFYAATDILVLPSRRAGETWGLVVNEALQAGCAVVISEAVGCAREFGELRRVRTIPIGDAGALARAINDLATFPRQFGWARKQLEEYSTLSVARALAEEIRQLAPSPCV